MRLSTDQNLYREKLGQAEVRLQMLEGEMETARLSAVATKRISNPNKLKDLHEQLRGLTRGDIFSGEDIFSIKLRTKKGDPKINEIDYRNYEKSKIN